VQESVNQRGDGVRRSATGGARLLSALALLSLMAGCQTLGGPADDGPSPPPPPTCASGRYQNDAFGGASVSDGVLYSSVADDYGVHNLRMDIYQPQGDTARNRAAIVWVHGGHFRIGTRAQLAYYATAFAIKGYVTASIDYRLLRAFDPVAKLGPSQAVAQSDAQAAVRYLRAHASQLGIDPERIAVAGWSAGSITAFAVGYKYEFVGDNTDNPGPSHKVSAVVGLDSFTVIPSDLIANDPPFQLLRAELSSDDDNPKAIPELLARADRLRIPHELRVVPGADHEDMNSSPYREMIVAQAAPFLRQHFACR
jgi:dienelactone hydrolase